MKTFESFKDIAKSNLPISTQLVAAKLLCGLVEACTEDDRIYEPEEDGHIILIEESDPSEVIEEALGQSIEESRFEPGYMERGFFITCILTDDQYGVTVMIPDGEWLGKRARENLSEACCEKAW